tara:strand:- start:148 stop:264 length:117 start_codon:yes stop_codon:yes gene_type:complete
LEGEGEKSSLRCLAKLEIGVLGGLFVIVVVVVVGVVGE